MGYGYVCEFLEIGEESAGNLVWVAGFDRYATLKRASSNQLEVYFRHLRIPVPTGSIESSPSAVRRKDLETRSEHRCGSGRIRALKSRILHDEADLPGCAEVLHHCSISTSGHRKDRHTSKNPPSRCFHIRSPCPALSVRFELQEPRCAVVSLPYPHYPLRQTVGWEPGALAIVSCHQCVNTGVLSSRNYGFRQGRSSEHGLSVAGASGKRMLMSASFDDVRYLPYRTAWPRH